MNRIHTLVYFLLFSNPFLYSQDITRKEPVFGIIQTSMLLHQPPFKQCHASTLVELKDGSILVAFFGGSYEGAPDVKIWATMLKSGCWTDPVVLADGKSGDNLPLPCWNPVLFRSVAGRLYLFYKVGKNPREWFGMMKFSDDDGQNWSGPVKLPGGVLGPIKNKPVELANGNLLCPSSLETLTDWKVQLELYDPVDNTWEVTKVDSCTHLQVIQPTILSYNDTTFRILCRSKNDAIITSLSIDNGKSWNNLVAIDLPNPNSGIDGVTLHDGSHLLVYNPLKSGKEWINGRNQLNLAWSPDGLSWKDILILENEKTGEFSYPSIIQSSDNLIHITCTHNRSQVRYWKLQLPAAR
jgi:predicted neuraminidase